MHNSVKISIIMPVFNGSKYFLQESISSILNQQFSDFELIIIDDGSYDDTYSILTEYQKQDNRIRIIRNIVNVGIVQSLNLGLSQSKSDIIARMDCGDIALPNRLKRQYDYLISNTESVLVSSNAIWIDECGAIINVTNFPNDDSGIRKRLISTDNILLHPAVMFRKKEDVIYRNRFCAEDYDMWLRLSLKGKLHILAEPLIKIRLIPDGTTYSKKIAQVKSVNHIYREFISYLSGNSVDEKTVPVPLSKFEMFQENLFFKFTKLAMLYRGDSKILYVIMKILSGVFCPYYVVALLKAKLLFLTAPYKAVTRNYLCYLDRIG